MAVTMMQNGYMAQSQQHQRQFTTYMPNIPGPPSPPLEENSKCSLPGISSLLDIANDPSAAQQQQQQAQIQQIQQVQQTQQQQMLQATEYHNAIGGTRGLPPTPPMQTDVGYDDRQSPSSSSQYTVVSAPIPQPIPQTNFYFPNNMELQQQQQQHHQQQQHQQQLRQQQVERQRRWSYSNYTPQYTPVHATAYYPPTVQSTPATQIASNGLYYQRPLPNTYTPDTLLSFPSYQHHHHAPTSSTSSCADSHKYPCNVCSKKFSRPSSLKIHMYSHTGEKPSVCSFRGCGKAFSVRSNMKRHEKGCHPANGNK